MSKLLDIDTPEGAREYISYASNNLIPRKNIDRVTFGCGEEVNFSNMTDEQAVRVARSLYLDIELPAAKGSPKQ